MTNDPEPVRLPAMAAAQTAAWHGLLDVHTKVPAGWALIGGQLVHLHCAERDAHPERTTDDADTVVDVRAAPDMLQVFTRTLRELGFAPKTTGEGRQHRWRRGVAQIDVLLPDGIGERAAARPGVGGAPSLETPGGTQALERAEPVRVQVGDRIGTVLRPTLVGALVIKAAAHAGAHDAAVGRHRRDFVTLAALAGRADLSTNLSATDRRRLRRMVDACLRDPLAMSIPDAVSHLERLRRGALSASP